MADHLESRLVVAAPEVAVQRRLPGEGVLAPADRGRHDAGVPDHLLRGTPGITCSSRRRADGWDKVPRERLFASLTKELGPEADVATRAEARAALVESVEVFCTSQRRHSSRGYVSPAEEEQSE
jgi:hypothetical protein